MSKICQEQNIKQEFTVPYNPEQNRMAERMNRTLTEMVRCMLQDSGMDKNYWAEAFMTAADIRNVLLSKSNAQTTPYELATNKKPDMEHMQTFGNIGYAHVPKEKRKKLDNTSIKVRMLGYPKDQKGYRVLNMNTGEVIVTTSVKWNEESQVKNYTMDDNYIEIIEDDEEIIPDIPDIKKQAEDNADIWKSPPGSPVMASQVTKTSETPDRDGTFSQRPLRPARKKKRLS